MLFESTKTLLRTIVQSLEEGDKSAWDDRLESGIQCLYELHQMSRPSGHTYQSDKLRSKNPSAVIPISERAAHAIPHVKLMVSAVRRRDHAAALQSGRAAMIYMNGAHSAVPLPSVPAPQELPAQAKAPTTATSQRRQPPNKGRSVTAKRKPARTSAASGR
jgi:hypothetical protein